MSLNGNPTPMLIAWISGDEAKEMEDQQTDDVVLDNIMGHLLAMFPSITRPKKVLITRWGNDDHFQGS